MGRLTRIKRRFWWPRCVVSSAGGRVMKGGSTGLCAVHVGWPGRMCVFEIWLCNVLGKASSRSVVIISDASAVSADLDP